MDGEARPSADDPEPVREGARLGERYELLRWIGRGASAMMYAALDVQLNRTVAIKVLHRRSFRFRREARALARISHPNVAQVHQVGVDGGREFIAMEFVDGDNLAEWQRDAPRTADEILEKYVQAARGLHAAHLAGIVHRDFKPENAMLGRDGRVRVIDFGLARDRAAEDDDEARRADLPSPAETAATAILGTPAYMAPEQLQTAAVDERADQFSLCAALYEALHGVRVFEGATLAELRMNALAGVIQEPPSGRPLPVGLRAILDRGLAADPAARWPSMAELADRIEASRTSNAAADVRPLAAFTHACVLAVGVELAPLVLAAGLGRWSVFGILCAGLVATLFAYTRLQCRAGARIRATGSRGQPRSVLAW